MLSLPLFLGVFFWLFSKQACSFALSGVSIFLMKQKDDIYPAYVTQYETFGSGREKMDWFVYDGIHELAFHMPCAFNHFD